VCYTLLCVKQYSKWNLATGIAQSVLPLSCRLEGPGFESRHGSYIDFFSKTFRLGSNQRHIQWVSQRPEREAVHPPPCSVEVDNKWSCTYTHLTCLQFIYWDNFLGNSSLHICITVALFIDCATDDANGQTVSMYHSISHVHTFTSCFLYLFACWQTLGGPSEVI
jgi:hypothetical protein